VTLDRGEAISAGCALALLVLMFAFAWYGVDGLPARAGSRVAGTEDAWSALSVVRWLMLLTIGASFAAVAIHWRQRGHGTRTSTAPFVALLGLFTSLVLAYRVLIELPSPARVPDQKLGALLGLLAALGIAIGGWDSVRGARRPLAEPAGSPAAAGGDSVGAQ
jgi:hypothetical protein